MASQGEDDLQASTTEGFRVGEKKTVEEYAKLGECMKLSISDDKPFIRFHNIALKPFIHHIHASTEKSQVCARFIYSLG